MTYEHWMYIWSVFIFAIIIMFKELYDFGNFLILAKKVEEAEALDISVNQLLLQIQQYKAYLQKLIIASEFWFACRLVCIDDPDATGEDVDKAEQAAKEVVAICHEGQQAGYTEIDYEKIMAQNLGMLNELKNRG